MVTDGYLAQVPLPPADVQQIASLIVSWAGIVLSAFALLFTVVTLSVAVAGFFGIREIRNTRRGLAETQKEVSAELTRMQEITTRYEQELQKADSRVEAVVQSAYGFNQGQEAYVEGNYLRAVEFFRRAQELQPGSTAILYRLGRAHTNLGNIVDATAAFDLAISLDGLNAEPHRGLALCLRYSDEQLAIEHARRATDLDAKDPKNWNCLGLLLRDAGRLEAAVSAHENARRLDPGRRTTEFYLSLCYAAQNRPGLAGECIAAATQDLDRLEVQGRLKPLWKSVLQWGQACFDRDEIASTAAAEAASDAAISERRLLEVRGHMVFLLSALGRTADIQKLPTRLQSSMNGTPGGVNTL